MNYKQSLIKRLFDIILSFVLLVISSPIFVFLILILALVYKGNPFFIQKRPGLNTHLFSLIKFKTMNNERDDDGNLLPAIKRVTKIGRFIRRTSLDELPQLVNVIIGDMSIVGPRPLRKEYLPYYNKFQQKRHDVRPGITGWAQIKGRNSISWEKRFELDVWYINNWSFLLDMNILCLTFVKIIKKDKMNNTEPPLYPFKNIKLND